MELNITTKQLQKAEEDFIEKVKAYREIALDDSKSKQDLKEAANTVIRTMAAYIDLQKESRNELIFIGQILSDYLTGIDKKPNIPN